MPKPVAKIYFVRGSENIVNDIAARIRNEGNDCHLVYAGNIREKDDIHANADAVAIQASASNAAKLGKLFRIHAPKVEVHYFDDQGEFCDAPADAEPATADPFASLKTKPAAPEAEKAADAAEPVESDSGTAGEPAAVTEQSSP